MTAVISDHCLGRLTWIKWESPAFTQDNRVAVILARPIEVMIMEKKEACAICGQEGKEWVLIKALYEGSEKLFCMRCFHPLMHGMSPEELKRHHAQTGRPA